MIKIRKGQAPAPLSRAAFGRRFHGAYLDPACGAAKEAVSRLEAIAWDGYTESRKAPMTRKAGSGLAAPRPK